MFEKYILWLQKRESQKVISYRFRIKDNVGWGKCGKIIFSNKERLFSSNDPYSKAFMAGKNFRECCYDCHYANMRRVSDLTLGDFWGIQRNYPNLFYKDGVSAVLINSPKGQEWINELSSMAHIENVEIEKIIPYQTNLQYPTLRPDSRGDFYKNILTQDICKYMEQTLLPLVTIKDRLRALIPMRLKYTIKRLKKDF